MRYRIYYSFRGYGTTWIDADNEDDAREKWDDGEYETGDEDTEDYNIDEITSEEAIERENSRVRNNSNGPLANDDAETINEKYCSCGNPVEEVGELCDQCWITREDLAVAAKK